MLLVVVVLLLFVAASNISTRTHISLPPGVGPQQTVLLIFLHISSTTSGSSSRTTRSGGGDDVVERLCERIKGEMLHDAVVAGLAHTFDGFVITQFQPGKMKIQQFD